MPLYFAFGSNMSSARLRARIGEVEVIGRGRLDGHAHAFDKLGADGTGKGNVFPTPHDRDAHVWGAVYRVDLEQLALLDGFEGGYRRTEVGIWIGADQRRATTYVALKRHADLQPTSEYVEHYVVGMREHGMPEAYIERVLLGLIVRS